MLEKHSHIAYDFDKRRKMFIEDYDRRMQQEADNLADAIT